MLPDRVSNPGPLTYESRALPIALHSPASAFSELIVLARIGSPSSTISSGPGFEPRLRRKSFQP